MAWGCAASLLVVIFIATFRNELERIFERTSGGHALFTRPQHRTRFALALASCAFAGSLLVAFAPRLSGLVLLVIYSIPANSVLPFPHEPAVLFAARFYAPVWVALAGTIGAVIVSFADYGLVEAALRDRRAAKVRETRLFRWSVRCMRRAPFWVIVLFAFGPLPISIIRFLAPASEYPMRRYVGAIVLGRFPRFLLLAAVGQAILIPAYALLAIGVVATAAMLLASHGSIDRVAALRSAAAPAPR